LIADIMGRAKVLVLVAAGIACSSGNGAPVTPEPMCGTSTSFSWATGQDCPLARFEASGAVVGDELWVMGGFTSAGLAVTRRIDIYAPETDTWRPGPDLPGAETHMAVVPVGSDIIVAGGFPGAFSPMPVPTAAVWRYDATAASWVPGPGLPVRGAAFAWALLGTSLHLAGGLDYDGRADAATHFVWDLAGAASWKTAAPIPNPRNHGGGAAAGGLFHAIAGRHRWDEVRGNVGDVDAFDPATGVWTARAPIPSARSEIGAATSTLSDGRIIVIGGALPGIVPSAEVFLYDPGTDEWSTLPCLPEPRKGAVALQVGRRLIVATGSPTSTDPSPSTFVGCCL
jgi:N-acetylneuraminic acid mutarotase